MAINLWDLPKTTGGNLDAIDNQTSIAHKSLDALWADKEKAIDYHWRNRWMDERAYRNYMHECFANEILNGKDKRCGSINNKPMRFETALDAGVNKSEPKKTKLEEEVMSRQLVDVQLWDNDPALDVDFSFVGDFPDRVTEDDDETVIREVLLDEEVTDLLDAHNSMRQEQIDQEILKRTGNEVFLTTVKLKNLTWKVVRR